MDGAKLIDYAIQKFQDENYEEALEAFVLAYDRGYEQEWILDNIYSCYMQGNEAEFRETYETLADKNMPEYEACTLDFIPYKEGAYYIFDKELLVFRGIFSMTQMCSEEKAPILKKMEFSAAALAIDWDWTKVQPVLTDAKERKIYAVCRDMGRAASFLKIPELQDYMKNVKMFPDYSSLQTYFHQNTSVYLPMVFFGVPEEQEELIAIRNQEHAYRLTPEGRNTDNVLLTIGIPTHDRGNLLLERLKSLQELPYDSEVEIAISKNGTHYYQEEYMKAAEIPDSRINYVGYDGELTMSINWEKVVQIAHGKFVMLVSDEDDVIPDALEHYLKLLSSHENLGYVRSNTYRTYSFVNDGYFLKGREAFLGGFLAQNYLSGAIYRRQFFLESDIDYWNQKFMDNRFYHLYPHMWWQVVLAFKGDYATDGVCLVLEGECVLFTEIRREQEEGLQEGGLEATGDTYICGLATYGDRIQQFQAMIPLINDFGEFDEELRADALRGMVDKTAFLMEMVYRGYNYKVEEFPQWIDRLSAETIKAVGEVNIGVEYQKKILERMLELVQYYTYLIEQKEKEK